MDSRGSWVENEVQIDSVRFCLILKRQKESDCTLPVHTIPPSVSCT